jgi:hypothetical protein
MFAFVDESGHTGQNLIDDKQPVFYYLGIISKYNIDVLSKTKVMQLCDRLSIERLHGSELGHKNELVAGPILKIIRDYSPHFIIAEVEKRYLALTKMFDTIFDSGENLGARNHVYSFRSLRLLLLFNFSQIVDEETAYYFYDKCLFAETQEQANGVLIEVCYELKKRIHGQFDYRTNELLSDALKWAIENPNEITTYNATKEQRWRHLPNVVAFVPTMQVMAFRAKENKTVIKKITHDEQIQMKKILEEAHIFSSNPNAPSSIKYLDNQEIRFKELQGSIFEIASSKTNTGLQIVDFILYNWKKKDYLLSHPYENPNSIALLNYYSKHMNYFEFSYKQLCDECKDIMMHIQNLPLTEEQLQIGTEIVQDLEVKFKEKQKK